MTLYLLKTEINPKWDTMNKITGCHLIEEDKKPIDVLRSIKPYA